MSQLLTDEQRKILQGHYLTDGERISIRNNLEEDTDIATAIDKLLYALLRYQNTLHYALAHEEAAKELLMANDRISELEAQVKEYREYMTARVSIAEKYNDMPNYALQKYDAVFHLDADDTRYEAPPLESEEE